MQNSKANWSSAAQGVHLLTVPYGVSLAHQMKKRQMEIALAAYLILVSVRFMASFHP